ncbi:MAG TPA: TonB-dependent receptor, partial [Thermoanaerobaculia bacterium]|nr:TonB-dependent receptor [Thermoanaerobaculia bacterium]
ALSPGVTTNGPGAGNAITISGAQSWENLFTLNGVVLNENIRGQAFNLFIEDAIQETTTQSGGISAEYGRFTGGVVTAITKSGGNEFTGSFRTSFTSDEWQSDNDLSPETRDDTVNEVYEATLGGYVVRDRLWFFGAGRDLETTGTAQTAITAIEFPTGAEERRLEGKLTGAVTESHQLQGSYLEIEQDQFNVLHGGLTGFGVTIDDGSLDDVRSLPQEFLSVNYTGILTQNLFAEVQYSERAFTFEGSGGKDRDLLTGTPVFDLATGFVVNESLFCDGTAIPECRDEERDNEQGRVKLSYFLSTEGAGSHDLGVGYETFTDIRASDNHQSPNDLMIWNFVPSEIVGTNVFPVLNNQGLTWITHLPILNPTQGTDFKTDSVFVNDRWRLNERWSFNLGARYDDTHAVNSNGATVADSDAFSPRLGASWDLRGDGRSVVHASLGRYIGPAANGVFDNSSPAGNPALFAYGYFGPTLGAHDPIAFNSIIFDWFRSVPGCENVINFDDPFQAPNNPSNCPAFLFGDIPGGNLVLDEGLSTTSADEVTLGYQHQFGTRGRVRLDLVRREFGDFFATRRDLSTGQVIDGNGNPADLGIIVNDDDALQREYTGVSVTGSFGFLNNNRLRIGGNATFADAEGNFDGETSGSGPVTSGILEYPEYSDSRWNAPVGRLGVHQDYVGRVWALFDVLRTDHHLLNVSLLQNFSSGEVYSATASIDTRSFVTNPGYESPPTSVTYFFSDRGEFETDDITRTDLALNYSLNLGRFEVFVQPEVLNVFNEDGVVGVNQTVQALAPFNPFTTQPVEGVHWEKGANFGKPLTEGQLQPTRLWRFSVGLRFNR